MRIPIAIFMLVGALLFLQCAKDDGDSPKAKAAGPAGKVVSLTGSATASSDEHGERALAMDSVVYASDRIVTNEDTAIEVVLEHNNAIWTVQGAKSVLISESTAWRASGKPAGLFPGTNEVRTSAAGRHSETTAADDPSVALAESAENPAPAESTFPVAPTPPKTETNTKEEPADSDEFAPPSLATGKVGGRLGQNAGPGGGNSGGYGIQGQPAKKSLRPESGATPAKVAALAANGSLDASKATVVVRRIILRKLQACVKQYRGTVRIAHELASDGHVVPKSITIVGSPVMPTETRECMRRALATAKGPTADAVTALEYTIAFESASGTP